MDVATLLSLVLLQLVLSTKFFSYFLGLDLKLMRDAGRAYDRWMPSVGRIFIHRKENLPAQPLFDHVG